jgi:hypothetical protein
VYWGGVDRTAHGGLDDAHSEGRYMARGVSADKEDVHNAIRNVDKGLYPNAFCKIIPDYLGGDDQYCNIMHAGARPPPLGSGVSCCAKRRSSARVAAV